MTFRISRNRIPRPPGGPVPSCPGPAAGVLREIFPSPEMAAWLAERPLTKGQLRDAVAYAPIPLARKRDLLLRLASGRDAAWFRRQAGAVEAALREMEAGPGEFFYLKRCRYIEGSVFPEERGLEPYLTWDRIYDRIREYRNCLEEGERELTWFQVEKWAPDGAGGAAERLRLHRLRHGGLLCLP